MKRVFTLLLLILLPITDSEAAISHRAELQWLTVSGEHFNIHYPKGEAVRERLQRYLRWVPKEAVDIILSDESDLANGMATFYPSNRMLLYVTPPDSVMGLEDYGDWLDTLITHEYLHILHLDKGDRAPAALREIFGRFILLFPNVLQPSWFIEGLATYQETDKERGIGRGQSSYYRMIMRMEYAGGVKPLRQINQPLASWPMGTAPYLYGVYFFQYLHDRYGEEKIRDLIDAYSNNLLPFAINSNSRQVLGEDLDGLWHEFGRYLEKEFAPELQQVRDAGETGRHHLTSDGYFKGGLQRADDGTLYLIQYDALKRAEVVAYRLQANGDYRSESLSDTIWQSRLHWHKTAGLLLAEPQICDSAANYYDLFRIDPSSGERKRLSECGRYRNALWSVDGSSIIAVRRADDGKGDKLLRLSANGELESILWHGHEDEVIGPLAISPGGKLVVSLWQRGRGWELALFDEQNATWRPLTNNSSIETDPHFIDERTLLFASDSNGIYNIHRLDIDSGEIVRLSNLIGGGFSPVAGGGDVIHYLDYRSGGFDLATIEVDLQSATRVEENGLPSAISAKFMPIPLPEGEEYAPWSSMRPRWWLPSLFITGERTELGFTTGGADLLGHHNYGLSMAHDFKNGWGSGAFSYLYDRYFPIFKLDLTRELVELRDPTGDLVLMRSNQSGGVEVVFPFIHNRRTTSLHIGIVTEREKDLWRVPWLNSLPDSDDTVAGIALNYRSTTYQPRAISKSDGIEALLVVESSDVVKSDYSGGVTRFDLRGFYSPTERSVIALQMMQGVAACGARQFELGGLDSDSAIPTLLGPANFSSPFNRRSASLRGYPEGLPQLSGRKMRKGGLELRLPTAQVERGWMAPPIGLDKVHTTLFTEAGAVWGTGNNPDSYYRSYGIELNIDTVLFYGMPMRFRLGTARGIDEGGENQSYLKLGGAF